MDVRLATLLTLSLCTVSPAQGQLDELSTISGKTATGQLKKIDAEGRVHLADSEDRIQTYDLADLRRIRLAARKPGKLLPTRKGTQLIYLRSGLWLSGTVTGLKLGSVSFETDLGPKSLNFAMRNVVAVRMALDIVENDGGFTKYRNAPKDDLDVLSIRKGGKVVQRSGVIREISAKGVTYEARGKMFEVALADLYGLVRARNSGVTPDPQPRPRVTIAARSGETLSGRLLGGDDETVTLRVDEGIDVPMKLHRLSEIRVQSDRLVYLTDLEPIKVEQTPAFERTWPWFKDRSPSGSGIQLGGRPCTGLVLVPKTRLTFRCNGRFDTFAALIGIEDRAKGPAHAILRVYGDKKLLFESKPLTRRSKPQEISVSIVGVDRILLEADFGKNFDFGDHCVFADARLMKQAAARDR